MWRDEQSFGFFVKVSKSVKNFSQTHVYSGQVDESWYPMKHQMKTRRALISKHTFVYIKITITEAKISILLFIVINLLQYWSLLGADYMANFSPGWNFSPVSRAEISPRPPEQIFLKRRLRLHGENFSPGWDFANKRTERDGWDFQLGLKFSKTSCNRIKISARTEEWAWACSVIVFSAKQDGGLPLFSAISNFSPGWN